MTEEERSLLRKQIEQTIAELKESVEYLTEATQPVEPSVALGRLTRMEAIVEKGVNEARLNDVKRRLERMVNALARMDAGTYGRCIRCGKDIPLGRLQAVPESLICVSCAEKR